MERVGITVVIAMTWVGCQHAPALSPEGGSSFTFVEALATSPGRAASGVEGPRQPVDVLQPAEPIPPLATPLFPAAARGRGTMPVMVGVRVVIGADGRVASVGPSLRALTTAHEFAAEFFAAVESAVSQWRFVPAELRRLVPGRGAPTQEDYWVVTRAEKTEYAFDVSFTFDPHGGVTAGSSR